ncbi:MAG: hypothetical protein PF692_12060 [Kiritimatiellae bacterium]|jgi:O-antigen/teichoic acid export membrane protein|nr:hypothetical protein [Kiritimatiellia bacterium]
MFERVKNVFCKLKNKCPAIVLHSGMIFVFSQCGAVINFITNLLIVPKYLEANDLGLIAPVTQFVAFGALPLSIITNLVIKYVTKYEANEEWGKLKSLVRDLIVFGIVTTVLTSCFFLFTSNSFAVRAKIDSRSIIFWMLIYLCVSSWTPLVSVLTRAAQRFYVIAIMGLLTPLVLMLCSIFLLPIFGFSGYLVALIASVLINVLISGYSIYKYLLPHGAVYKSYFQDVKPLLKKYLAVFVLGGLVGWLWAFIPPFAVRNFLSAQDSAGYFFVKRLSMLPFYAFSSMMFILMPILSMKHEKKESASKTVKGTIIYTVCSGLIVTCLLYVFSPFLFEYVPQWREYSYYSKYIWIMSINVTLAAVNGITGTYLVSRWVFKADWYRIPVSFIIITMMYCLFGWGAFRNVLPFHIWSFIDSIPKDLYLIIYLLILNSVLGIIINVVWCFVIKKNPNLYGDKHFV